MTTNEQGLVETAPPPLSRGASLFPPEYRAAWGPVQPLHTTEGMPDSPAITPSKASGGMMAPILATLGRFRVATRSSIPAPLPGPRITGEQNSPPYWRPSLYAPAIAPGYCRHVRVFSDHPLPVPAQQAWSSNPVAQRRSRIGGQKATNWPPQQVTWPTFGPGGT